ncbi:glutamate decarboxylase [Cokeromyces recurvatus]|uniref:glutamate decarboxylase n=1 Tax=Cokeromyces recurvatus TaxID=90255 RepID=UPI002220A88B|nr:glutamate decarboxylase [Cokeromyces recurvatus]KAI7902417.1 glutamate decarboxylase [Cokeromyces recurvatus]
MVFLSRTITENYETKNNNQNENQNETSIYGTSWATKDIPRYQLPEEEMPSNVAYHMIKDETALDGTPALNLASFVTTYMEDEAERLMTENLSKNFIDFEQYPQTAEISNRCVNIIARLFNAPVDGPESEALGCSTIGSSEALILCILAMKRRWQIERKSKGLATDKPNMIAGANCHVAFKKAMKYLDIEPRTVPCTREKLCMDPVKAVEMADENTIGICAILGSTYTGEYEDIAALNKMLKEKNQKNGWDIGIHVDAASGGFVAPFVTPDLVWDFRLELVHSINVSGHKYGLTYPGVGWALWRGNQYLPEDLIFNVNYLGSEQATFTLNFSKDASNVIAQYYVLIRLGRTGFTHIMKNLVSNAEYLANKLEETGRFEILSARNGKGVPLVAFHLKEEKLYDEFDVSAKLREHGWIVPAYTMAPNMDHLKLLRVVVREDFSHNRCEILLRDIQATLASLDQWDEKSAEYYRKFRSATEKHKQQHRRANYQTKHKDPEKKRNAPGAC